MADPCTFCEIVGGRVPAEIVWADEWTVAFVDLRQPNEGHTLVIPRRHVPDARALDEETGAALLRTALRVLQAVDRAFPSDGMSLWHSIGPGAFQEVPHLHLHILPRRTGDGLLEVYPDPPADADPATRARIAEQVRRQLDESREGP